MPQIKKSSISVSTPTCLWSFHLWFYETLLVLNVYQKKVSRTCIFQIECSLLSIWYSLRPKVSANILFLHLILWSELPCQSCWNVFKCGLLEMLSLNDFIQISCIKIQLQWTIWIFNNHQWIYPLCWFFHVLYDPSSLHSIQFLLYFTPQWYWNLPGCMDNWS